MFLENKKKKSRTEFLPQPLVFSIALIGLFLVSRQNYLIFHSLSEVFCIVIAFGIFMFAWNSRDITDNNFLVFLGIAYLFVGAIDFLHTLPYEGMGELLAHEADPAVQLWIVGRYIESTSLVLAIALFRWKLRFSLVFLCYFVVTSLLLGSIFILNIFPACIADDFGPSSFKINSEYSISVILAIAADLLFRNRKHLEPKVFQLLFASILLKICSELSFIVYGDIVGLSNLIGHYFKIISFFLIYTAIIRVGLGDPYKILFRQLSKSEYILAERVKELDCLYGLSKLVDTKSTLDGILQGTVEIIPPAWQYPEISCAQITLYGVSYQTDNFKKSSWVQSQEIKVSGEKAGVIEVHYFEEKPEGEEGPFRKEERELIIAIAEILGNIVEKKQADEALKKAHDELEQRVEERTFELKSAHDQLLHAEKLAAVGRFSASIAHEINNPLQGLLSAIQVIQQSVMFDKKDNKLFELAVDECHRLKDLIQNLHQFCTPTTGIREEVNMNQVIDEIIPFTKKQSSLKRITVEKKYMPSLPLIWAVSDQMKQFVFNILVNAVDATGAEGGMITFTTAQLDEDSIIITIRDSGEGIERENIEEVFEPFYTTKSVEGTGLGLPVSYGIIKSHGGDISVESEVGKGATFTITLPIGTGQE